MSLTATGLDLTGIPDGLCETTITFEHIGGVESQPFWSDDGTTDLEGLSDGLRDVTINVKQLYEDAKKLSDTAKETWEGIDAEWHGAPEAAADFAKGWLEGGSNEALEGLIDSDLIQNPINDASKAAGNAIEEAVGEPGLDIKTPFGLGYDGNEWYGTAGLLAGYELFTYTGDGVCKELNLSVGVGGRFKWAEAGLTFDPTAYLNLNVEVTEFEIAGQLISLEAGVTVDALAEDNSVTGTLTFDVGSWFDGNERW